MSDIILNYQVNQLDNGNMDLVLYRYLDMLDDKLMNIRCGLVGVTDDD
jgi:hypothetical protein